MPDKIDKKEMKGELKNYLKNTYKIQVVII